MKYMSRVIVICLIMLFFSKHSSYAKGKLTLVVRKEPLQSIRTLAFSPDGKYLAIGAGGNSVKLWDLQRGSKVTYLKGKFGWINSVAFSLNGKYLAAAGKGRTIRVWEIGGEKIRSIDLEGKTGWINSISFSPNGDYLAAGGRGKGVRIWEVKKKRVIKTLGSSNAIASLFLSADKRDCVNSIAFSPDGKYLAEGNDFDDLVKIWDVEKGAVSKKLRHSSFFGGMFSLKFKFKSVAFSSDGKYLAAGSDRKVVKMWSLSGEEEIRDFQKNFGWARSIAFSPEGHRLAMGGDGKTVKVWDTENAAETKTLKGNSWRVSCVAFSRNGKYLAVGGAGNKINIWNVDSGKLFITLVFIQNKYFFYTPEGYYKSSGDMAKRLNIEIRSGEYKYPFSEYTSRLNRPNIIETAIREIGKTNAVILLAKKKNPPSEKNSPRIIITQPLEQFSTQDDKLILKGTLLDDKGIKKIDIIVNGERIDTRNYRGIQIGVKEGIDYRTLPLNYTVPLKEGSNQILIVAYNIDGVMKSVTLNGIRSSFDGGKVWALIIGINVYKSKDIRQLKWTVNDANSFYDYMLNYNKIPKDHLFLLLNEEATLSNIKSMLLDELPSKAGRKDSVFIYFAGHGAPYPDREVAGDSQEKFILTHDSNIKRLRSTALSMENLKNAFKYLSSERVILIADTCYSGAAGGRSMLAFKGGRAAPITNEYLSRLTNSGVGRVVMTASDANELSEEKDELQHGVFTYSLVEEGLKQGKADSNGDGWVSFSEAFSYVSERVPQQTQQRQHPMSQSGSVRGDIIIGRAGILHNANKPPGTNDILGDQSKLGGSPLQGVKKNFKPQALFARISRYINEILAFKVSDTYIYKLIKKVVYALRQPCGKLLKRLFAEAWLNSDETKLCFNIHLREKTILFKNGIVPALSG